MNVDVALTYLDFVAERHRVWEARQADQCQPWTADPVVGGRKFTNVFRVLDPGSQFVLTDLWEPDLEPRDFLARVFLYRYTNLPDTWRSVRDALGRYPLADDMDDGLIRIIQNLRDVLGRKVFSGAYIILPQPQCPGDKVAQAVRLAGEFVDEHAADFLRAGSQAARFRVLRELFGVGDFMAMQILTDYGYGQPDDREREFIVPGPGCVKGAQFIDPAASPRETLRWAYRTVRSMPDCPVVQGRRPSLMDVQNTLCEFSKYHRFAGKPVPKAPYRPAHPGAQAAPVLPVWWG